MWRFSKYFEVLNKYLNICKKLEWDSLAKCLNAILSFKIQIITIWNSRIKEIDDYLINQNQPNKDSIFYERTELLFILQNGFLNPKFLKLRK